MAKKVTKKVKKIKMAKGMYVTPIPDRYKMYVMADGIKKHLQTAFKNNLPVSFNVDNKTEPVYGTDGTSATPTDMILVGQIITIKIGKTS